MGAVDNMLREHAVLHTTAGACDPNTHSLVEESVGARKRGIRCLLHQANAPVCLWPDAAERESEVYNHNKRPRPGHNDTVEPIVLERRAFSGQAECFFREKKNQLVATGLSGVCDQIGASHRRRGSLDPIALQGFFVGWNRRVPQLRLPAMTERLKSCSRVRLCEEVTQCSLCSAVLARSQQLRQRLQEFGEVR